MALCLIFWVRERERRFKCVVENWKPATSSILLTTNHLPTHCAENRAHLNLSFAGNAPVSKCESPWVAIGRGIMIISIITSYHFISYRIIFHIISYHIISFIYIISYHFIIFHFTVSAWNKCVCFCRWHAYEVLIVALFLCCVLMSSFSLHWMFVTNERGTVPVPLWRQGKLPKKWFILWLLDGGLKSFQIHYPYFTFCFLALILECDTCQNISKRISLWRSCIT